MTRRARLLFVAVGILSLLVGLTRARAAWHQVIDTDEHSGVVIEVSSPFDSPPPSGYYPLWVTIRNSSGAARAWSFTGSDDYVGSGGDKMMVTESFRVENGQSARFPVLMPLGTARANYYYRSHSFKIEGHGIDSARATSLPRVNATRHLSPTPVVGMSEDLATPIWAALTKWYTDHSLDLLGSPVDLTLLGGDWRALAGLDVLWLTDAGYATLDASRRGTIRDWVSQGGVLCLCAQTADPSLRAAVGLPETGDTADVGLGRVLLLPWDGKGLPLDRVTEMSYPFETRRAALADADADDWGITHAVGAPEVNAPLLILFIVAFAIIVGPLNLFVFANSARRHRLFWTTPLISVAASLLLMVFITVQDGFGGVGRRVMFCLLLPDQKKVVVFQEQAARTGVLFSRQFHAAEDLALTPLHAESHATRTYQQTGRDYAGDWFASRSVQALRAEAVVPSRAEITLVNADAARDGAPPVVASTVPASIQTILYLDPQGRHWKGESLRTGERVTLRAFDPAPDGLTVSMLDGSKALEANVNMILERRGSFVAVADEGPFFDTLPAIRWNTRRAVFAGAVTGAR